jgi:predicted DNA-binding protein with PD1-like motif
MQTGDNTMSHTLPKGSRPRTLVHPGPLDPIRIRSLHSRRGRHIRLMLQPGLSLFDALVAPLGAMGIRNASTTLLGGVFSRLHYCVAPPDPSGQSVAAYSAPIDGGQAFMIFGNATLGNSAQGAPLVHCHAVIRTAAGLVKGGHVLVNQSILGPESIAVLVTSLDDFELRVRYDPETNLSLLQPQRERAHA